jgi:hypothetical protein
MEMPLTGRPSRYDVEEILAQARMWRETSDQTKDSELRDLYLRRAVDCERLVQRSTTVPAVALRLPKVSRFVSLQAADELRHTLARRIGAKVR